MQVDVEIPATAHSGAQEIVISMGAAGTIPITTQSGVTVAVQ
jgi:fructose-1-phosphate kinase PfkB-like protein